MTALDETEAAIDAVKRYASTGYVRNNLVVFHNHAHAHAAHAQRGQRPWGERNGHANGNGHAHAHASEEGGTTVMAEASGAGYAVAAGNGIAVAVAWLNGALAPRSSSSPMWPRPWTPSWTGSARPASRAMRATPAANAATSPWSATEPA